MLLNKNKTTSFTMESEYLSFRLFSSYAPDSWFWEQSRTDFIFMMWTFINSLVYFFRVVHWVHIALDTLLGIRRQKDEWKLVLPPGGHSWMFFKRYMAHAKMFEKFPKAVCISAFCYLNISPVISIDFLDNLPVEIFILGELHYPIQ